MLDWRERGGWSPPGAGARREEGKEEGEGEGERVLGEVARLHQLMIHMAWLLRWDFGGRCGMDM